MEFLVDNWTLLVAAIAVIAVAAYAVYGFIKMPHSAQMSRVQEWLLWAVAEAEKELGSGTGVLKLRMVYDMFVGRFPTISRFVTFETFSIMVDKALEKLNKMLQENRKVETYVETGQKTLKQEG